MDKQKQNYFFKQRFKSQKNTSVGSYHSSKKLRHPAGVTPKGHSSLVVGQDRLGVKSHSTALPCGNFSVRSPTTVESTDRSDKPSSKAHNTTSTRISSYKTHSNPKSFTRAKIPNKLRPAPYFKRSLGDLSKRNSSVTNNSMGGLEQISEEQKSFDQFHKNKLKLQSINEKIKYLKSGEAKFVKKTHKKNPSRVYGYKKGK